MNENVEIKRQNEEINKNTIKLRKKMKTSRIKKRKWRIILN